jgi:hypothetical protein
MDWRMSPFIVPLGAFAVAIVAIVSGVVSEAHKVRIKAEQRMAMVARGMSAIDIDMLLGKVGNDAAKAPRDPMRSMGNVRRAATVLISSGLGIVAFGLLLTWIVREEDVLVVAACGLIPIAIGIGFVVDYGMQKRELARFGMEITPGE